MGHGIGNLGSPMSTPTPLSSPSPTGSPQARAHSGQPPTQGVDLLTVPHAVRVHAILEAAGNEFPYRPHFRAYQGSFGAYIDVGPKDAPVLLCVHGNPTWAFFYRALLDEFSDTYRVVVPDHIGMGLSQKPARFDYTLANRIAALEDLVLHLKLERITLVAHDWGGAIGLGFAGRHPGRMQRLVLSNTAAFPGGKAHGLIRLGRLPGLHQVLMGRLGLFEKITVKHATRRGLSPTARAAYLAPFSKPSERVAVQAFVRDIPLHAGHPSMPTLQAVEANLSRLQDLPTLLLWGEKDWVFTPAFRKQFEARFPGARSVPFPDAGHLIWEDERERCVETLRAWLAETPSDEARTSPPEEPSR